jgi:meiosis-specific APC/C activator protein AMA1
MTLLARIKVHTQQICGLAWSPDGEQFVSGGNDNLCCLFSVDKVTGADEESDNTTAQDISPVSSSSQASSALLPTVVDVLNDIPLDRQAYRMPLGGVSSIFMPPLGVVPSGTQRRPNIPQRLLLSRIGDSELPQPSSIPSPQRPVVKTWQSTAILQTWRHLAAVKAMAFCPWRPHLLATGGGSNDKMIHFFHTTSGAALATISVNAQVTSLVWSKTRREIAATFGYAQPDHEVRIAIFSWPDCKMVGCVRWEGEHRALFAVPYPGGPTGLPPEFFRAPSGPSSAREEERPGIRGLRGDHDGCLIVACSDESIKFHEVWRAGRGKTTAALGPGVLGGSDIIEMAEGIDKEGDVIR